MSPTDRPIKLVIAGGGIAALEAMLAARHIGGDRVDVHLFAPRMDFVMKPLGVPHSFGQGEMLRYDLDSLASKAGATFHLRSAVSVDRPHRRVLLRGGVEFTYDYLIVATGTKALWVVPGAKTFWGLHGSEMITELRSSLHGTGGRVLLTMPDPAVWPLPIYELAIFLAAELQSYSNDPRVAIVSPEPAPLTVFGDEVTVQIRHLLDRWSIDFIPDTIPRAFSAGKLETSNGTFSADAAVTLPRLTGRHIGGLPFDGNNFLPVDGYGRIRGCDREYAAGDVVEYPVKFGGAATEQADVVAASIAAQEWGEPEPAPYTPELRAVLITPDGPVRLGSGESEETGWNPVQKVRGRFLTPALTAESAL